MGDLFSDPDAGQGAAQAAGIQAQAARAAAERDQQRWAQEQAQTQAQKEQDRVQGELDAKRLQQENDLKTAQEKRAQDEEARAKAAQSQVSPYDDTDAQLRKAKAALAAQAQDGLPGFNDLKKKQAAAAGGYLGQSNTLASRAGVNTSLGGTKLA